jgi:Uma2 family endonuclease
MAPQLAHKAYYTAEEYLAFEAESIERHELIHGEIYAMAGGTAAHASVSLNVASALKSHLRGTPCQSFMADMRLNVQASDAYFYPDVFVTCGAEQRAEQQAKTDAVLIVEVLSPSTAAFDRGAKFGHYRLLPSLNEYLIIDIETRTADLYRKAENNTWVLHPYSGNDVIELASVSFSLPLDTVIFEDIDEPITLKPNVSP